MSYGHTLIPKTYKVLTLKWEVNMGVLEMLDVRDEVEMVWNEIEEKLSRQGTWSFWGVQLSRKMKGLLHRCSSVCKIKFSQAPNGFYQRTCGWQCSVFRIWKLSLNWSCHACHHVLCALGMIFYFRNKQLFYVNLFTLIFMIHFLKLQGNCYGLCLDVPLMWSWCFLFLFLIFQKWLNLECMINL